MSHGTGPQAGLVASERDLERRRRITELVSAGLNLAGVRLVLELEDQQRVLQDELDRARAGPSIEIRVKPSGRSASNVRATPNCQPAAGASPRRASLVAA